MIDASSEAISAPFAMAARPAPVTAFFETWFTELDRLGEKTSFRLGRATPLAPLTWFELPHATFDGLGGLSQILADEYATKLELPTLPGPYPGHASRWFSAARLLLRRPPRLSRWRREPVLSVEGAQPAAAWFVVTKYRTDALRQRARAEQVSLTALLLAALSRAVSPLLAADNGGLEWVVPINMRGLEPGLSQTENQAVTLDVHFPVDATAGDVHAAMQSELARGAHFGAWQLLRLLGALGSRLAKSLVRRELLVRKHGSFSNLGNLRSSCTHGDPEWWIALNPVQSTRPIGAACVTYNGRLALSLNVHPVLGLSDDDTRALVEAWARELSGPFSSNPGISAIPT